MNKKAFTLVELLTTIVIIAFIMGIILPSASRISSDNKEKMYKEYEKMVAEYAAISPFKNQAYIPLESLDELQKVQRECTGYVVVTREDDKPPVYTPYLSCGDYHSDDYDPNKVGQWSPFSVPTCRDLTYNGSDQELIQNIRIGDKYVFSFEKDGVATNVKKNSGTYNVTVKIAHKDSFSWDDNTQDDKLIRGCEIKKKNIVLKANDITDLRYGETPQFTHAPIEGEISGETALTKSITYTIAKEENGTMVSVEINNSIPIGSYTITPHSEVSDNYQLDIHTGVLTVLKNKFRAQLNNQNATQSGTTDLYEKYGYGWYKDADFNIPATTITIPSKDGYTFEGYYTSQNGGGTQVINASGEILASNTSLGESDTVFYAKWTACGKGYYCANGEKKSCPAGTYGKDGVTTATSESDACNTCEKGYYCGGVNDRHACGDGKYNDQEGQSAVSACKTIPAGCYGTSGTTECPNECTGRTQYSAAGSTSCSSVDTGYYSTDCDSSGNKCGGQLQCSKGTYCSGGVQANCSGRTEYTSTVGATSCSTVSSGYYSTGCNSSGNACTGETVCPKGSYCSSGIQYNCSGRTKYTSSTGKTSCSTVSSGYYTTGCNSSGNACTGQTKCSAGNYCTNGVSNSCGTYYYSSAGASSSSSCYDNSNPVANAWASTDLSSTSVGRSTGTTTICHLGSDNGVTISSTSTVNKYIYYGKTSSFGSSAKITNGCATISISASSNPTLYYYLYDGRNKSGTITVTNFGKYLFFGMEYNQLLYAGGSASNNSNNLGHQVAKNNSVSAIMRNDIGGAAINTNSGQSNDTFVRRLYLGLLGRSADSGGLNTWVSNLNNGKSRADVISSITNSTEYIGNLSAWGYS